jgi:hypothetical protein
MFSKTPFSPTTHVTSWTWYNKDGTSVTRIKPEGQSIDSNYALNVHEYVHRGTTVKIAKKMHYLDKFIIVSRLYMFREMFSLIIKSTLQYLQYLLVFTQVAAGWCPEWFETQFQLIWDNSRQ